MQPLDAIPSSCPSRSRRRAPARTWVIAAAIATLWLLLAAAAHGQNDPPVTGPDVDAITARIAELEALATPDDDQSAELAELQSATGFLDKAAASEANTPKLAERAQAAPDTLARIQAELAQAKADLEAPLALDLPPEPAEGTSESLKAALAPLEARLESAKAQQQALQQLLEKAKKDADDTIARQSAIPQEIADASSRQQDVTQLISALATGDDQTPLDKATLANLLAEARAISAGLPELDQELQTIGARKSIRQARIDLAQAQADQTARVTSIVQTELDRRSATIAARRTAEAEQAQQDAISKHPIIGAILERNAALAAEEQEVARRRHKRNTERDEVQSRLESLKATFDRLESQIKEVGLNEVIGLRLRTLRTKLADLRVYDRKARRVSGDIKESQTRMIELEGEAIGDPGAEARRLLEASTDPVPAQERDDIIDTATAALTTQQEYRDALGASYEGYIDKTLIPFHHDLTQITELDDQYLDFIQERILWIQSADPIGLSSPRQLGASLVWITDRSRWTEVGHAAWQSTVLRPVRVLLYFVPFVTLIALRRPLRRRLERFASKVKRASTDSFIYTVRAAVITVLLALPFPALLWALARLLSGPDVASGFALACAAGLDRSALILLSLTLVWHVCRPHGIAEAHFHWRQNHLILVRRNIGVLFITVPMAFITAMTDGEALGAYHNALGRLTFCVSMAALAFFNWRVLHPKRGVLHDILAEQRGSWLDRLQAFWFAALVTIPLALIVAACAGYFFTAREMSDRVLESAWVILIAIVINNVLLRWLYVVQRRLAVEQLRRRFEAEREAAEQKGESASDGLPSEVPQPDEVELDVEVVSRQTRRFLMMGLSVVILVGMYFVWAAALPALGVLDNIPIWSPDGADPITVADLGLAIIVVFVTLAIARNIPGVLEILVLQRLPMSSGGRYATRTLVSYAILIIGMILAFDVIGIGWSKVQWLAAAVSVGLGFGLQEIFANFVSGLIILTERPVRMGDTVTVGGVSGTVTRIQMRATTVTDWDRKELIIPNKEFVTGQITNWTLTNAVLRITLEIGIAYGSDTETAKRLMLEVAQAEESVLDDPPPRTFFIGFGDNSLNFQLRVFIDDVDHFSAIRDRVNMAVDKAFREANIEIAFPQRDLHIRSVEGALAIAKDAEPVADALAAPQPLSADSVIDGTTQAGARTKAVIQDE